MTSDYVFLGWRDIQPYASRMACQQAENRRDLGPMSDKNLHDEPIHQDWHGGPSPVRAWLRGSAEEPLRPVRAWLHEQLGTDLADEDVDAHFLNWKARGGETDQDNDLEQDKRATGPSTEQERRCRELDEESGQRRDF